MNRLIAVIFGCFALLFSATLAQASDLRKPSSPMVKTLNSRVFAWVNLGGDPLFPGGVKGTTIKAKRLDFQHKMRTSTARSGMHKLGLKRDEIIAVMRKVNSGKFSTCNMWYGEKMIMTTFGSPVQAEGPVRFVDPDFRGRKVRAFCVTAQVRRGKRMKTILIKVPWPCVNISIKRVGYKPIPDACPNTPGYDYNVPPDLRKDDSGNCRPDVCPNLTDWQFELPEGYFFDKNGNCIEIIYGVEVTKKVNRKVVRNGLLRFVIVATNTGNTTVKIRVSDYIRPWMHLTRRVVGVRMNNGTVVRYVNLAPGKSTTLVIYAKSYPTNKVRKGCNVAKAVVVGTDDATDSAQACTTRLPPIVRNPRKPGVTG